MSIQTKKYTSKVTGKETEKHYAVVYDPVKGAPVWSKGFDGKRDAKAEEARMIRELEEKAGISKERVKDDMKFDEVAKLWLKYAKEAKINGKRKYANATYEGYKWYYEAYIKPVFGEANTREIFAPNIERFIDAMEKKYSAEVINKCITILSNIFKYAIKPLYITEANPALKVKRKKVVPKEIVTWTSEQICGFISYPDVRTSPYFELMLTSFLLGPRPSEVCGLRKCDLKPDRVLIFDRGYDRYGEETDMKNDRSHRKVLISQFHYDILINRLKEQNTQALTRLSKGKQYDENDFLFKQPNGRPINPSVYSKNFKKLIRAYTAECGEELELPDICLYNARHSFATNLVSENNAHVAIIASIMGNSERVCNDRYVNPYLSAKEAVVIDYQENIFQSKKILCAN